MSQPMGYSLLTLSFFKLYFIDYVITVVPIFPPLCASTQHLTLPQATPTPLLMSIDHVYKLFAYSISCTVLYIPLVFCNYLFVLLIPLTSSPIPPPSLSSGNHQNALCIHDSVSVMLVSLVCFLDSIVDRFMFFLPFYCS